MAHHKQLSVIHEQLDKAKNSPLPERRALYEHVEREHLAPAVKELKGKVHVAQDLPFGLMGLNYYAAKSRGLPWHYGHSDVAVAAAVPPADRPAVAQHERREAALIRSGEDYDVAHSIAGVQSSGGLFSRV